jgi:hypothetical protein
MLAKTPHTLYGSDQTGLICGYIFSAQDNRLISSQQAEAWLQKTRCQRIYLATL